MALPARRRAMALAAATGAPGICSSGDGRGRPHSARPRLTYAFAKASQGTSRSRIPMTTTDQPLFTSDEVPCARHPKQLTRLRCSRCGTPICPLCAVRTPVGLRCPDCAGVRGLSTYATPSGDLARGAGIALLVGVAFALLFAWIPEWNFYLSLGLGFGVAEVLAWAARNKRGADLQILGIVIVIAAMALGRAVLAYRLELTW